MYNLPNFCNNIKKTLRDYFRACIQSKEGKQKEALRVSFFIAFGKPVTLRART